MLSEIPLVPGVEQNPANSLSCATRSLLKFFFLFKSVVSESELFSDRKGSPKCKSHRWVSSSHCTTWPGI